MGDDGSGGADAVRPLEWGAEAPPIDGGDETEATDEEGEDEWARS